MNYSGAVVEPEVAVGGLDDTRDAVERQLRRGLDALKSLSVEPRQSQLPAQPLTDPPRIIRHHIADLQSVRGTVGAHPLTIEHRDAAAGIREP